MVVRNPWVILVRSDKPYILCAYIVPDSAVSNVEAELRAILGRHWSTPPKELHFNRIPPSKLAGVLLDISSVFQSNPDFCVCLIGTKHGFLAYLSRSEAELHKHDEKPIKTSWAYKLADSPTGLARATLIFILEELLIHIAVETVDIQTPMEIVHDRKHREWMNEALETAFKRSELGVEAHSQDFYGRSLPLKRTFSLVESAEQPCLWIPDWICWEVARWWKDNTWSQEFEQSLDKITFITFDQIGTKVRINKPGGTPVAEFPDSPRDVESI